MKRTLLPLAVIAIAGLILTAMAVFRDAGPPNHGKAQSASSIYSNQVAGAGLVEGASGTIQVATPVSGVVARLFVNWGQPVSKGEPLFAIDVRDLQAQLPLAADEVSQAQAAYATAERLYRVSTDPRYVLAIPKNVAIQRRTDFEVAAAALAAARDKAQQVHAEIRRRTVMSPISGRVLKINVREGEYAQSGAGTAPILVGNDARLNVRVEVDENDADRVTAASPARAFLPAEPSRTAPLRFERIEPFVTPKISLSGAATEKTDSRVLQIIYSFDPSKLPAYIGQRVDVLIDTGRPGVIRARPAR